MRPKRWLYKLAAASIVGACVNFFLFFIVSIAIGGNTWHGKHEGGRYYLNLKGKYTEVSVPVWTYSKLHGMSVFVGFALGVVGTGYAMFYEKCAPAAE